MALAYAVRVVRVRVVGRSRVNTTQLESMGSGSTRRRKGYEKGTVPLARTHRVQQVWCIYIGAKVRTKEVGTKGRGIHVATPARPAARPAHISVSVSMSIAARHLLSSQSIDAPTPADRLITPRH